MTVGREAWSDSAPTVRRKSSPGAWNGTAVRRTTPSEERFRASLRELCPTGPVGSRPAPSAKGGLFFDEKPRRCSLPNDAVQMFRGSYVVFVRDPNYLKPDGTEARFAFDPFTWERRTPRTPGSGRSSATGWTVATSGKRPVAPRTHTERSTRTIMKARGNELSESPPIGTAFLRAAVAVRPDGRRGCAATRRGHFCWDAQAAGNCLRRQRFAEKSRHKPDDWCSAHNVPESVCVECCRPELLHAPRFRSGWCKEFGVHDSPASAIRRSRKRRRPRIPLPPTSTAQGGQLAFAPRQPNGKKCTMHEHRIQLASDEVVTRLGIGIESVGTASRRPSVTAPGEIEYDPDTTGPVVVAIVGRGSPCRPGRSATR